MPEPVVINGKKFITSKEAARLTGYARDYVGQLVRMGKVEGKVVEKVLFVNEESLLAHVALKNSNTKVIENSFKTALAAKLASAIAVKKSVSTLIYNQTDGSNFLPKISKVSIKKAEPVVAQKKLVSKYAKVSPAKEVVARVAPYADALGKVGSYAIKHAIGFAILFAVLTTSYASIQTPDLFFSRVSEIISQSSRQNAITSNTDAQLASVFSPFNSFAQKVNHNVNEFFGIGGEGTTIVQLPSKVQIATTTVVKEIVRDIGTTTVVQYITARPTITAAPVAGDSVLATEFQNYKIFQQNQLEGIFDSIRRSRNTSSTGGDTINNYNATGTTTLTNLTVENTSTSTIPSLNVTSSFTLNGDTITDFVGSGLEVSNGVLSATAGAGFSTTSANYHFDNRLAATTTLNNITNLNNVVFNNATTSSLTVGSDYITDLTGSGLTVVNGALTVSGASGFSTTSADYWETTQTRWATTSDSYAFDTRLAATTTLNNVNALGGLASVGSTTGTTTINGSLVIDENALLRGNVRISAQATPSSGTLYFGEGDANRLTFDGSNYMFNGLGAVFTSGSSIISQQNNSSLGLGARYNASLGTVYFGASNSSDPDAIISNNAGTELFRVTTQGNLGLGTSSPYAKLSVVGQAVAEYFTATSTTATSTFPLLSTNAISIGGQYFTSFWGTSTDSVAFDARLAATTTLNNLTTLRGLTDIISTSATTTNATSTNFFATTASTSNLFVGSTLSIGTSSTVGSLNIERPDGNTLLRLGRSGDGMLDISMAGGSPMFRSTAGGVFKFGNEFNDNQLKSAVLTMPHFTSTTEEPVCLVYGFGATTTQTVNIGGGNSGCNAATGLFFFTGATGSTTAGTQAMGIGSTGNVVVGPGSTNPLARLYVQGSTTVDTNVTATNFTATSTTGTSTFPLISTNAISINGQYFNSLWGTSTDSVAFDARLAATTTLNNLTKIGTQSTFAFTHATGSSLYLTSLNCTTNNNGGKITTDSSGQLICANDQTGSGGGGGGTDVNWTFINESGIAVSTTSNQVVIGASATSTLQKLEVTGGIYLNGSLGIGTTSPSYPLSVNGNAFVTGQVIASYFSATSTNATSTLPSLSTTNFTVGSDYITDLTGTGLTIINGVLTATNEGTWATTSDSYAFDTRLAATTTLNNVTTLLGLTDLISTQATTTNATSTSLFVSTFGIGSDYINDLTGTNLSIVNGALTVTLDGAFSTTSADYWETTQTRWATTSDSYAFDTRLAATTTLNNLTTLRGLADVIATRATTTNATSTNFFATTASSTNLYTTRLSVATTSQQAAITVQVTGGDNALFLGRTGTTNNLAVAFEGGRTNFKSPSGFFNLTNAFSVNQVKQGLITVGNYDDVTYSPRCFGGAQDTGVIGPVFIGGGFVECLAATTVDFFTAENASTTVGSLAMRILGGGNVGIGTTSPYAKLSVAGQTVAEYFTATSTTATSTLPLLSTNAIAINGQYFTSLWGTTTDSLAFDTRLAATTTLNNITNLNAVTFNQATTSSLAITGITSSLLKTNSQGSVVPAILGTDYIASAITAIGPTNQIQTGATVTIATSTSLNNGFTSALTVVGSGNTLTFTPSLTGTLSVAGGGTGQTSFGQGWLNSDGTTITSSTSPTVAYITATSTTATSTLPMLSVNALNFSGNYITSIAGGTGEQNRLAIWGNANTLTSENSVAWDDLNNTLILPTLNATNSASIIQLASTTILRADNSLGNFFAGQNAGISSAAGSFNTGVGQNALSALVTGAANTALGQGALNAITDGSYNIGLGYNALTTLQTGSSNVVLGSSALPSFTSGDDNIVLGSSAGNTLTTGSRNILIGSLADITDSISNSVAIGYNSRVTASNSFVLGNNVNVGIGTTSPYAKLSVAGQTVAEYFTATSTTATSTLPLLSTNAIAINGQYFTSLWGTTTDSLAFDTRLAATTTLNNLNTLGGLASIGSTTGTTTFLGNSIVDGNFSVGSTTPWGKFVVTNTGAGPSFLVEDSSSDTTPFVIDTSGNIGIGTSSPSVKFEIGGGTTANRIRFDTSASSNRTLDFERSSVSNAWSIQSFLTNNNSAANIILNPNGGSVGIATTSTSLPAKLSVGGDVNISGDTYIGGRITATSSSFQYIGHQKVTTLYTYGDSITEGSNASSSQQYYVSQLSRLLGYTLVNQGVSGSVLEEDGQIDNIYAQVVSTSTVATILTGYNNHRYYGTSASRLDTFKQALPAALAYLAIPDVNKKFGYDFSTTGSWTATSTYATTTGISTRQAGATASTVLNGSTIYIAGTRGFTTDSGTVTVTVDGVDKGTFSCSGVASSFTDGRRYAPFMMRIGNLTNGQHNVTITSNTSGYCEINWAAGNSNLATDGIPAVYAGGALRMTDSQYDTSSPNGSLLANRMYNEVIEGTIKTLAADGLNVVYAETEQMFDPSTMMSFDNVHPGATGHYALTQAFIKVMSGTSFGTDNSFARFLSGYIPKLTIGSGTSTTFTIDGETGRFGVGTSSPIQALSVNGNAWITGNATSSTFTATSTTASSTLPLLRSTQISVATSLSIGTTSQSEQLTVGDTAVIGNELSILELGSQTDAGVYFGNDANTGLFAPALDTFAITTGGTERLRVDSVGDIGIGSTSPFARLSVDTSGLTTSIPSFSVGSSTKTDFMINGVNGNISIGTTTSNRSKIEILHPVATPVMNIDGSASGADVFRFYRSVTNGGSGNYGMALKIQTSNPAFTFRSGLTSASEGTILNGITHVHSLDSLVFSTSTAVTLLNTGIEPFYLKNSTSNIGLAGTTTPWGSVGINGIYQEAGEPTFVIGSSTKTDFVVHQSGFVGVGTTSPWRTFSTNGSVAMNGLTTAAGTPSSICMNTTTKEVTVNAATSCVVSDRDQKQKIEDLSVSGLDAVRAIKTVTFSYNDLPNRSRIGFIAQDLQAVDNRLGDAFDKDGIARSIDIPAIMSVTVKAVQELDTKVDTNNVFVQSFASSTEKALKEQKNKPLSLTFENGFKFEINEATSTEKYLQINSSTGADVITFDEAGNIGIGDTTPDYKLQVAGDIAATAFVNVSTRNSKKDITYLEEEEKMDILKKLGTIKIAQYRYKAEDPENPLRLGLIAEEAPVEVLSASGKGVDIYKLSTFTLGAVQVQQKKISELEIRLSALEAQVASSTPAIPSDMLASFMDGMKNIFTDTLTVGSATKPSGITLFDEKTGEPYCIKVVNGEMKSTSGKCTVVKIEKPTEIVDKPAEAEEVSTTTATTTPAKPEVKEDPKPAATSTPAVEEKPKEEAPKAEEPKVEESKTETPVPTTPVVEAPKEEAPKTEEAPKVEEKKEESKPAESAPAASESSSVDTN